MFDQSGEKRWNRQNLNITTNVSSCSCLIPELKGWSKDNSSRCLIHEYLLTELGMMTIKTGLYIPMPPLSEWESISEVGARQWLGPALSYSYFWRWSRGRASCKNTRPWRQMCMLHARVPEHFIGVSKTKGVSELINSSIRAGRRRSHMRIRRGVGINGVSIRVVPASVPSSPSSLRRQWRPVIRTKERTSGSAAGERRRARHACRRG